MFRVEEANDERVDDFNERKNLIQNEIKKEKNLIIQRQNATTHICCLLVNNARQSTTNYLRIKTIVGKYKRLNIFLENSQYVLFCVCVCVYVCTTGIHVGASERFLTCILRFCIIIVFHQHEFSKI